MSRRNFILLVIVLAIVVIAIFGFLVFNSGPTTPGGESTGTNFFSQFNPFASSKTKTPPTTIPPVEIPNNEPGTTPETTAKLIKVSTMPVAGFAVFSQERIKEIPATNPTPTLPLSGDGATTTPVVISKTPPKATKPLTEFAPILRYVDRASGNIYETFADKIFEQKFSITVIPQIYEAVFGNKGQSVVMRYLKSDGRTIETFAATLPKELLGVDRVSNNEIKGAFLPENIKDMSLSPDTSSIFYLFNNVGNMVGTTMNLATSKKVQIFISPFTEWLSQWPNPGTINLTTKPASGIPGYVYSLNTSTKSLTNILSGINGLTTLASPNGKLILYSNDNLSLNIYHTDTKVSTPIGVRTLSEKCVWGSLSNTVYCAVPKSVDAGTYPDSWYQGEASFSDQIWKIDVANGNTSMLIDPATVSGGEEIDGTKLALDDASNYLFFVNKKDSNLWELNLK
ncbi:hypothetical protein HY311_00935 [Candidatus Nomurabacteria bacterium]|nr:hypothetical protein [Candidatus Nomurabacteria bacterium]